MSSQQHHHTPPTQVPLYLSAWSISLPETIPSPNHFQFLPRVIDTLPARRQRPSPSRMRGRQTTIQEMPMFCVASLGNSARPFLSRKVGEKMETTWLAGRWEILAFSRSSRSPQLHATSARTAASCESRPRFDEASPPCLGLGWKQQSGQRCAEPKTWFRACQNALGALSRPVIGCFRWNRDG